MASSYSKSKGRSADKQYFGLPYRVTESPNFKLLSAYAVKLLVDVGREFRGSNNGDLCATWSMMQKRGWKSRETLNDALRELEYYGFLVLTQQGDRRRPNLYALTWLKVDKATKLSGVPVNQISGGWKAEKQPFVKPSTVRRRKSVGG